MRQRVQNIKILLRNDGKNSLLKNIKYILFVSGEARQKYGDDNVKVYQTKFTNMYYSMLENKPKTAMKLVLPQEKVSCFLKL